VPAKGQRWSVAGKVNVGGPTQCVTDSVLSVLRPLGLYGPNGLRKGDDHTAYTVVRNKATSVL